MAARVFSSVPYALIRLAVWIALFTISFIDGLRHRHIRSRGWQLYTALVLVSFLFLIRNLTFLAIAVEGEGEGWASDAAYGSYIFFSDVAESVWIAVLLAISAGYCITRNNLGQHKNVVTIIPIIFFLTSLVVDYVLFSVNGKEAFAYSEEDYYPDESSEDYDPTTDTLNEVTPTEGLIFALCAVANSMAFILSWFYMYDTARAEWESLQGTDPSAISPQQNLPGTRTGPGGLPVSLSSSAAGTHGASPNTNSFSRDTGVGHAAVPVNAALLEEGQNASHMYGDVAGEDLDAPKNVADRIADREKAKLMRQFFMGVCVYVTAAILVFFLPAFVPVAVDAALVIGYDALLWLFVAVLLFVFRMREGNQYLNLTEEGAFDGPEMTTELGVISHDDDNDVNNTRSSRGFSSGPSSAAAVGYNNGTLSAAPKTTITGGGLYTQQNQGPTPPAPRFTLEDEEERANDDNDDEIYEDLERQPTAELVGPVNASAAQQGVVVTTLPSPRP